MSKFTIYDNVSGEISMVIEGDESDASLNGSYVSGEYSAKEYTIVNGAAVRRNDEQIETSELFDAWEQLRILRNGMLTDSDWTQATDSPLSDAQKLEWQTYRSSLRSLPENTTDPRNPTWPSKPS